MNTSATALNARHDAFWKLHEQGCFILPNPWDAGSARWFELAGYRALASTSAGFAFTRGRADGAVGIDEVLDHLRDLVQATELPVNADFENGLADTVEQLSEHVRRCVETGVSGLSIEDSSGRPEAPLYALDEAVERMQAARAAIDASGQRVMLVGRAECFLLGRPDLDETIRRLQAYDRAGADCLYAPGLHTAEQISAVVQAVAPKPVNVLWSTARSLSFDELAALGVRRISVGGTLALAAWSGFVAAVRSMEQGRFDGFETLVSRSDLGALFGKG